MRELVYKSAIKKINFDWLSNGMNFNGPRGASKRDQSACFKKRFSLNGARGVDGSRDLLSHQKRRFSLKGFLAGSPEGWSKWRLELHSPSQGIFPNSSRNLSSFVLSFSFTTKAEKGQQRKSLAWKKSNKNAQPKQNFRVYRKTVKLLGSLWWVNLNTCQSITLLSSPLLLPQPDTSVNFNSSLIPRSY